MYISVIIGRRTRRMVSAVSVSPQFSMNNRCPTISIPSCSPSISLASPLNPHAESWIPEAAMAPFGDRTAPEDGKLIMLPYESYSTYSTTGSTPLTTLLPPIVLNEPCQSPGLMSQPMATSPYSFRHPSVHYYEVSYFNGVYLCNDVVCLQPQCYLHPFPTYAPTTSLISWSCTKDYEADSENLKKEKDETNTQKRFVPPRIERSLNMVCQGRKKTLRQEWMPKRARSESDRLICADAPLVSSLPYPTKSSMEDFGKTTLMIRNIPNQYRRSGLMQFLDIYCKSHNLEYDFFYLPMDFRRNDNLGYAFVNFTTPAAAVKIIDLLEGFEWYGNRISGVPITSKKICTTSWADIQGKNALVRHFQNSHFACDDSEYLPVILSPPSPRSGSETSHLPITVGKLMGLRNCPRLPIKKPSPGLHP